MCICLILFSFHVPCVTSLSFMFALHFFCARSRGAEHMTLGTLAGTYSMCIVSGPFQEGTITRKNAPAISVNSYYAPFLSLFLVFLPGPVQVLLIFTCKQNKFNLPLFLYVMFIISSYFSFVLFIFFKPVSLLLPYPSGICSYLFISRTFFI